MKIQDFFPGEFNQQMILLPIKIAKIKKFEIKFKLKFKKTRHLN